MPILSSPIRYLLFDYISKETETYKSCLTPEDRRRRDRRIPRCSIRHYNESSFKYLYDSRNDQALLNLTGLDHASFNELLELYKPYYKLYTWDDKKKVVRKLKLDRNGDPFKGRPRLMDAVGSLGLVFAWYRTRGACTRTLSMAFGLTCTPMYNWLKFGRRVLLACLLKHDAARVTTPTANDIEVYKEAITRKYPRMRNVWGACDGLKLQIEQSKNWFIQNQFFNGWTHGHYVNCIFVFAADGRIRICVINTPGTWHDSTQADHGVYAKMEKVFDDHGAIVVVDSAFNMQNKDYLVKSSQQDPTNAAELLTNRDATSIRQLSEWGMRMLQAQFPRMKDRIAYEEKGERRVILNLMVLLYNFQCSRIGHNQIFTTFMNDEDNYYGNYGNDIGVEANLDLILEMVGLQEPW